MATCGGWDGYNRFASCLLLTPGGWQEGELGDLPEPRYRHAAVTLDAGTYIIGGIPSSISTTSAFLAAGSLAWTRGPGLPQDMREPCATRISPTFFMAVYGTSVLEFSTVTAGPTSSSGWRPGSTWPSLRTYRDRWPGCAVLGTSLVIAGGYDGVSYLSTTEVIDLQTGTIAWGPSMASGRRGFHLLLLNSPSPRLLALGGYDGLNTLESVEELVGSTTEEVVGGSWRQVEPLGEARGWYGAVVVEEDTVC